MRIQIASDLHMEFYQDRGKSLINDIYTEDIDVLVLAGDIDIADHIHKSLSYICGKYNKSQVTYTAGNHLFYHSSRDKARRALERAKIVNPNLHVLENSTITIKGQRFIGCTLWFPDQPDNHLYERYLNDFHVIEDFRSWNYQAHEWSAKYLRKNTKSDDIVITHHMPTMACMNEKYRNNNLNRFFVAPMDDVIINNCSRYWIAGHTHDSYRGKYEDTEIIINPAGYPTKDGLENRHFNPHLVIEV